MKIRFSNLKRFLRPLKNIVFLLLFLLVILGLQTRSAPPPPDAKSRVRLQTADLTFAFGSWTWNALRAKLYNIALNPGQFMSDAERRELLEGHLRTIGWIQFWEREMEQIYSDPNIPDKQAATQAIRAELDRLKTRRDQLAPYAEGILQDQISTVVDHIGLGLGGQPIPPVLFQITPLPHVLIISPRDKIKREMGVALIADLSVDQMEELEQRVEAVTGMSALVTPIGGMGLYPTMIIETSHLGYLGEVVAHEWVHNYLELRPLGMSYLESPEMSIVNETTAATADRELGHTLLEIFYPDLLPPPAPPQPPASDQPPPKAEPPAFEYRREMYNTRVEVDRLLAEGKVDEAEAYMEARRQEFWRNRYYIRKLNQAYFAFYGSYAEEAYGAAGEDKAGAAVRLFRKLSPSLADFLFKISWFGSFDRLQQALQNVTPPASNQ